MEIIEEHVSPDGFLRLMVTRDDDGDVSIGFDNFAWHTHGDTQEALSGPQKSDAIRQLIDHIVGDGQIIVVSRVNGVVHDVWPTDDPPNEFKYKRPEESLEFRRWSGVQVEVHAG
jgi:hypothetical protein